MSGFGGSYGSGYATGSYASVAYQELITEAIQLTGTARVRLLGEAIGSFVPAALALPRQVINGVEAVAMSAAATSLGAFHNNVTERLSFVEIASVVYRLVAVESLVLAAIAEPIKRQIVAAVEYFEATGLATSRQAAIEMVTAAVVLHELATRGFREEHVASAEYAAALTSIHHQVERAIEQLVVADIAERSLRFTITLAEGVEFADTATSTAHFFESLREALAVTAVFKIGGEEYVAWVLNTETEAVSRYSNFGFTSFAEYNGRYYGTMDDGIYELTGDDDDGDAINAMIAGGLGNFGSSLVKRMGLAYVGVTTDGQLVLKLKATDPETGRREVHWYRLEGRHDPDRTKPDQGVTSVTWGWELVNLDGAAFTFNHLGLVPLVTSRRV